MSKDDYVHIDQAVEVALENEWVTEEDIAWYLEYKKKKDKAFFKKVKKLLEKKGIEIRILPLNPSKRE